MEVFRAGLSYPGTPTRTEIEDVLSVLKGDWHLAPETNSVLFIGKCQFIDHVLALSKAIAYFPWSFLATILVGPVVSRIILAEPELGGPVLYLQCAWQQALTKLFSPSIRAK